MGPASTIRFLELVMGYYRSLLGATTNSEFPQIILYTIPESDHMATSLSATMLSRIEAAFDLFEYGGATFVVSPCNTIHQYFGLLPTARRARIVDIVDAVAIFAPARLVPGSRLLFLSTSQTRESNVYSRLFTSRTWIQEHPTSAQQTKLNRIILSANAGLIRAADGRELRELINSHDCDAVLLACTELSLFADYVPAYGTVDSLQALASAAFLVSSGLKKGGDFVVPGPQPRCSEEGTS
jgi:aspartate/glutamate racemase